MGTVGRLVCGEQQMPCPGPGPAPGPSPLLDCAYTLTMQKMNSWSFSSLNNIPDGAPACADLVLQTNT